MDNLANTLGGLGQADDAILLSEEAIQIVRRIYPHGRPHLTIVSRNLDRLRVITLTNDNGVGGIFHLRNAGWLSGV